MLQEQGKQTEVPWNWIAVYGIRSCKCVLISDVYPPMKCPHGAGWVTQPEWFQNTGDVEPGWKFAEQS